MSKPKISIIIVNYKAARLTRQCVRGIIEHAPQCLYEVIVVDNNSDDGCLDLIQTEVIDFFNNQDIPLPRIELVQSSRNVGFSAGNNLGFQYARGEYILYLNPDTVIFSGGLDPIINYLDNHADVGVVGPKILNPDRSIQTSCFRFPDTFFYPLYRRANFLANFSKVIKWRKWFVMSEFDRSEIREVDWLLGACMLVRRSAIDKVGLFDERFFLFLEDTDWCYRFWQKGFRVVYNPDGWIVHHIERASDENNILRSLGKKTAWIHIVSWLKYYKKHIWRNPNYPKFDLSRVDK